MQGSGQCSICQRPIADTEVLFQLSCGRHIAHGTHGTIKCQVVGCGIAESAAAAAGGIPYHQHQQPSAPAHVPQAELEARQRRLENNAARLAEPLCRPQRSLIGNAIAWTIGIASHLSESRIPDDESSDPMKLLKAHVPLETIRKKHGFDITELVNDHDVTIRDFFVNGYTMSDMCNAFSRMDHREGVDALAELGMTPEYLTACPQLSQIDVMRSRLGFTPDHLIDKLGYRFEPGTWTLPQMVDVGLTLPHVMRSGLRTRQEWVDLRATAQSNDDIIKFGATIDQVAKLLTDENASSSLVAGSPDYAQPAVLVAQPMQPQLAEPHRAPVVSAQPSRVTIASQAPVQSRQPTFQQQQQQPVQSRQSTLHQPPPMQSRQPMQSQPQPVTIAEPVIVAAAPPPMLISKNSYKPPPRLLEETRPSSGASARPIFLIVPPASGRK